MKLKTIRRGLYFYTGFFILFMTIALLSIAETQSSGLWLPFLLTLSALAARLTFGEYRRFKAARLIFENQILHIQPAVIEHADTENADFLSESIGVFVSCFGILIGAKIIKFNQDGIRLKAVEIRSDYISLEYGTDAYTRNIKLLHARPDNTALDGIIEKFRYETGIVPVVTE